MKRVNDFVCRHFPLSSTPKKHNISVTGGLHNVIIGSVVTYLVPHCRISYF